MPEKKMAAGNLATKELFAIIDGIVQLVLVGGMCLFLFLMSFDNPYEVADIRAWALRAVILAIPIGIVAFTTWRVMRLKNARKALNYRPMAMSNLR